MKPTRKGKILASQIFVWLITLILIGCSLNQTFSPLTINFCAPLAFQAPLAKISHFPIFEKNERIKFFSGWLSGGIKIAFSPLSKFESLKKFEQQDKKKAHQLDEIINREKITVAVVDSGLGGLSIMAEAAHRLERAKIYRQVNLVFFNALFSPEGGYNALPTREARIKMFDRVLASLEKKVQPNLILLACNTLSTLYPSTAFAQQTKIPVFDIITPGINLISEKLKENSEAVVIILATPITIKEDTHRQLLLKQGIASSRIFTQACPELELFIEKSPEGEETALLISAFLNEAIAKIPKPWPPVILSLNCTHYGYSIPLWERGAQEIGLNFVIINPNSSLLDIWLKPDLRPRFSKATIKAKCLSRVPIEEEKRQQIASLLRKISPRTALALLKYNFNPYLF